MPRAVSPAPIERIRRFNRFYTRRLGLLEQGLLQSSLSLSQARVLYELAHRESPTAKVIADILGLDPGYLSRMLRGFREQGLLRVAHAAEDRRRRHLALTPRGRALFRELDTRSSAQVAALLTGVPPARRERLTRAMATIETLLADESGRGGEPPRIALRGLESGDLGWVVQRHGELYAAEYGWNQDFERLVAAIVGEFAARSDSARERGWIATLGGARAGSIFLMRSSARVAQLRLLLVEPWARGHGLGGILVSACMDEARALGYQRITLWTNSVLDAARRLYQRAGFRLVRSERHHSFGHDLVGQNWERAL